MLSTLQSMIRPEAAAVKKAGTMERREKAGRQAGQEILFLTAQKILAENPLTRAFPRFYSL